MDHSANELKPQQLTKRLLNIHRRIEQLHIPPSTYAVIETNCEKIKISEWGGETKIVTKNIEKERNIKNTILGWFEHRGVVDNVKFVASEIVAEEHNHSIISRLWLWEDIVPYFVENSKAIVNKLSAQKIGAKFDADNVVNIDLARNNEVRVADLVTLDDYRNITDPDEFDLLIGLASRWKHKRISFINATPRGGGVAIMRHALIRLLRLLDVDAHWYILEPRQEAFDVTKIKFHNILQAVADPRSVLNEQDKKIYNEWMFENAKKLRSVFRSSDVIVIDDPQPSGLIPYIKKHNRACKIIYRSHIHLESGLIDKAGTPQSVTWDFLWKHISRSDAFISHPVSAFIPKSVPVEKAIMMPPTTDALDGLNKPLTPRQINYYLKVFDKKLLESHQDPLDLKRPFIIQIARFDPSKGIPDVIESYRILRDKLKNSKLPVPQLVITGNASVDDPDGIPLLNLTMDLIKSPRYQTISSDIKVIQLPHIDQLLNALLLEAKIALQLSHKEGFEFKVTEALMKGTPVIAYKAGGIPLQIKHGVSGFLAEVDDTKQVAEYMYRLLKDEKLYQKMKYNAPRNINPETSTVSNAINWLFLGAQLMEKGRIEGNGKSIKELIGSLHIKK